MSPLPPATGLGSAVISPSEAEIENLLFRQDNTYCLRQHLTNDDKLSNVAQERITYIYLTKRY